MGRGIITWGIREEVNGDKDKGDNGRWIRG